MWTRVEMISVGFGKGIIGWVERPATRFPFVFCWLLRLQGVKDGPFPSYRKACIVLNHSFRCGHPDFAPRTSFRPTLAASHTINCCYWTSQNHRFGPARALLEDDGQDRVEEISSRSGR